MELQNNFFNYKQHLIDSAQSYFRLLNISVVIKRKEFVNQEKYILRFFKDGFLHLTGLGTNLSKNAFFEKCLNGTIEPCDFYFFTKKR